jgi:hypothetical protein
MDHLHGLTISLFKGSPQALVPVDEYLETAFEHLHIDLPIHAESAGD